MSMDTSREDMVQAVLEGVAFGLRDSLEIARAQGINVKASNICGGGAKSPLWRRIIASVMNLTLEIQENDEGPALGGAILAAVGCGIYKDVKEASEKIILVVSRTEPENELVEKYEKQYEKYRKLYPMLKNFYDI